MTRLGTETCQAAGRIEYAVATLTLPGEQESGDRHVVVPTAAGTLVAVVDGLGHGSPAARASEVAIATLQRCAGESVITLVRRCHEAMKNTRGGVMSLAFFDARDHTVTWLSVGNVEGIFLHPTPQGTPAREGIMLRGGVVGLRLPPLEALVMPVVPDDLLIFATDGIRGGFEQGLCLTRPVQEIADSICAHYRKGTDDALVLVARYRGVTL